MFYLEDHANGGVVILWENQGWLDMNMMKDSLSNFSKAITVQLELSRYWVLLLWLSWLWRLILTIINHISSLNLTMDYLSCFLNYLVDSLQVKNFKAPLFFHLACDKCFHNLIFDNAFMMYLCIMGDSLAQRLKQIYLYCCLELSLTVNMNNWLTSINLPSAKYYLLISL